jgi:hypothetical protein
MLRSGRLMMVKEIDELGNTYHRLTVIKRVGPTSYGEIQWLCECICGKTATILGTRLRGGRTTSCGCVRKGINKKHGYFGTPTYEAWSAMVQRCSPKKNRKAFKNYAGRGISICKSWSIFESFLSDMGEKPQGLTLERVDNDKGYSKENCVWATNEQQARNRRSTKLNPIAVKVIRYLHSQGRSITDLAKAHNVSLATVSNTVNNKIWKGV